MASRGRAKHLCELCEGNFSCRTRDNKAKALDPGNNDQLHMYTCRCILTVIPHVFPRGGRLSFTWKNLTRWGNPERGGEDLYLFSTLYYVGLLQYPEGSVPLGEAPFISQTPFPQTFRRRDAAFTVSTIGEICEQLLGRKEEKEESNVPVVWPLPAINAPSEKKTNSLEVPPPGIDRHKRGKYVPPGGNL